MAQGTTGRRGTTLKGQSWWTQWWTSWGRRRRTVTVFRGSSWPTPSGAARGQAWVPSSSPKYERSTLTELWTPSLSFPVPRWERERERWFPYVSSKFLPSSIFLPISCTFLVKLPSETRKHLWKLNDLTLNPLKLSQKSLDTLKKHYHIYKTQ